MANLFQRLKRLIVRESQECHIESQIEKLERIVSERPYNIVSMLCRKRGVTPERFYVEVQLCYRAALNDNDFNKIKLIREITGINPGIKIASGIQGIYGNLAREKDSESLVALMEASGVPMFDTAQTAYLEKVLKGIDPLSLELEITEGRRYL